MKAFPVVWDVWVQDLRVVDVRVWGLGFRVQGLHVF